MFYWFDFVVSTITTVYFAIQWFVYTDHSLAELENDPEGKKQHDDSFKAESIVSIVLLCLFRLIHLYFAYVLTSYYISLGQAQYTKLRAAVDEELNPPGFNEDENDEKDQ
ncbi:uncharacterized protein B0P05DRAFT_472320 [Gilbertella persicaria]|uniref:uncharacterized protein n=1 Tax=Gilbertella persicaria TaxID=101096 RepID=UPI0022204960|nr:uncharacterized protein B0P05DRAFT_472320 [Gilbertella persicaria]KAI8076475.1 hypothetical protein B0P05DRAFT_472320 [Gilbertella persicaria]